MRSWARVLAAAVVMGLTGVALADQIDNPEYKEWSQYKVGTYVTIQQTSEVPGMAAMPGMPAGMNMASMLPTTKVTTKLTEVKADALTLEVTTDTTSMGQSRTSTTTRSVAAKIDRPTTTATAPGGTQAEVKDLKEGTETVEVIGKKVETKTREYTTTITASAMAGMGGRGGDNTPRPAHVKVWSSSTVPGGMVKWEQSTTTAEVGDVKMTMAVVDFKVVK